MSARIAWSRGLVTLAVALAIPGAALAAAPPDTASSPGAPPATSVVTPRVHPRRVIAYYFHTTARCASCRAIEAYAREAIESAFPAELADGRLVWKVVNIETKGNEHFVKDYGLYTKSVILVGESRGRPAEWKHLEKVWQLLRDKPAFVRYVQGETRAYLVPRS